MNIPLNKDKICARYCDEISITNDGRMEHIYLLAIISPSAVNAAESISFRSSLLASSIATGDFVKSAGECECVKEKNDADFHSNFFFPLLLHSIFFFCCPNIVIEIQRSLLDSAPLTRMHRNLLRRIFLYVQRMESILWNLAPVSLLMIMSNKYTATSHTVPCYFLFFFPLLAVNMCSHEMSS